jgi:hypothetical protein
MTTNINKYKANVNGAQTPLINTYSDIFTYNDTNTKNLPKISTVPFTAQTNNGIATVDSSGGIVLINPGMYEIDMEIIISQSNQYTGNNNWFNYKKILLH